MSNAQPKFERQSLSYKWDTELMNFCYVTKLMLWFCLHFEFFK